MVAKRVVGMVCELASCKSWYGMWVTTGGNIYYNTGNVGIGTNTTSYSLEVSSRQPSGAGVTSFPLRISADAAVTNQGNNTATLIGLATEIGNSSRIKCAIGHCRTDSFDRGSIVFLCNNTGDQNPVTMSDERMRITSTGNVGIGTNNPVACRLQVNQDNSTTYGLRVINPTNSSGNNSVIFNSIGGTQANKAIYSWDVSGAYGYSMLMKGNSSSLWFNNGGLGDGTDTMVITSTGNVGIGTTAIPSNSLPNVAATLFIGSQGYGICGDATGSIAAGIYIGDSLVSARWRINNGGYNLVLTQNDGSGTYNNRGYFANNTGVYSTVSDKRLKKLIEPIQYGLNEVLKFKPVSYLMINQNEEIDKRNLGLIAQDLENIIPEVVNIHSTNDNNETLSLQYTSIIPILIKAIQELNEIVTKNTSTSNMIV